MQIQERVYQVADRRARQGSHPTPNPAHDLIVDDAPALAAIWGV